MPVDTLKEMQEVLRGIRVWNVADPAFVGLVVVKDYRLSRDTIEQIVALGLAPVRLINWSQSKIVYMNGAEIRVRGVYTQTDACMHKGAVYWTVCYLQKITSEAKAVIDMLVKPPATHCPRKPGIRSRFQDKIDAELRSLMDTRRWVNAHSWPGKVLYNFSPGPIDMAPSQLRGSPYDAQLLPLPVSLSMSYKPNPIQKPGQLVPGPVPAGTVVAKETPRLAQDTREKAQPSYYSGKPYVPINNHEPKITSTSGDGLTMWTDDAGNIKVLSREALNAAYKGKPASTWEEQVNFFLAMQATMLAETQIRFQKQLDMNAAASRVEESGLNRRMDTTRQEVSVYQTASGSLFQTHSRELSKLRVDLAESIAHNNRLGEKLAKEAADTKDLAFEVGQDIGKMLKDIAALKDGYSRLASDHADLEERYRKQVGLLHKRVTKRKVEITQKAAKRKPRAKIVAKSAAMFSPFAV